MTSERADSLRMRRPTGILPALFALLALVLACDAPTSRSQEAGEAGSGTASTARRDDPGSPTPTHTAPSALETNEAKPGESASPTAVAAWWLRSRLSASGAVPKASLPDTNTLPTALGSAPDRALLAKLGVEVDAHVDPLLAVALALETQHIDVSLRPWLQLGVAAGRLEHGATDGLACPRPLAPHSSTADERAGLRACWAMACPEVVGASDDGGFLSALARCVGADVPPPAWSTAFDVRRLAAVATVQIAFERLDSAGPPEWDVLRETTLAALQDMAVPLEAGMGVRSALHPPLGDIHPPSDVIVDLGDRVLAGSSPRLVVNVSANRLRWTFPPPLAEVSGDPVDAVGAARDRGVASLGVLLPGHSSVRELRAALAHDPTQAIWVGITSERGTRWLEVRATTDDLIADALVQSDASELRIWVEPEKVALARLHTPEAERRLSGRRAVVAAPEGPRSGVVGVHDALADEAVARLILDLPDATSLDALVGLLHAAWFPRSSAHFDPEQLLAAPGHDGGSRVSAVFLSASPLPPIPLVRPGSAHGVALPSAEDLESDGPLDSRRIVKALERLESALAHCHERARDPEPGDRAPQPDAVGMITVEATVAPDGRAMAVRVLGNTTGNSLLPACVEDGIDVLRFPARDAETTFVATISFAPPAASPPPASP